MACVEFGLLVGVGILFVDPDTGDFPRNSEGAVDLSTYAAPKPDVWTG